MCGFDQSLMALVDAGTITPSHHHTITPSHHHTITPAEAIANAANRILKLRLASGGVLAMDDGGMSMAQPQMDAVVSRFWRWGLGARGGFHRNA